MTNPINQLANNAGEAIYSDPTFQRVLEINLPLLLNHPQVTRKAVQANIAYKNEGDFYGLLTDMAVQPKYWWLTLRLNGYTDPLKFDGNLDVLLMPPTGLVELMRQRHVSGYGRLT